MEAKQEDDTVMLDSLGSDTYEAAYGPESVNKPDPLYNIFNVYSVSTCESGCPFVHEVLLCDKTGVNVNLAAI